MLRLTNICDDPWTMERFGNSSSTLSEFLGHTGLDGFELIKWESPVDDVIPSGKAIGRHLYFWPIWLDFWREDRGELLRQFGDDPSWKKYYRAGSRAEFVANYRKELVDADRAGAQYAVFHVSHVQLEHCFNGKYTYTDEEIADAFAELLNEMLQGISVQIPILMENHWYPGLTFLKPALAQKLLDSIHYDNKGFVLDIGHMMNTNPSLDSEEEAVAYILKVLQGLGEPLRKAIRTIHLNSSLTGEYVRASLQSPQYDPSQDFTSRLIQSMGHVGKIDRHVPFLHPSIRRVIDAVQPQFLVYELATSSQEQLEQMVADQNKALGF
jgi:hypothetical protein